MNPKGENRWPRIGRCRPSYLTYVAPAIIALDTETKDDGLLANRGSGWPFGDGYVCGVSVAYRAGGEIRAHYFPLRHPDSHNFDREQVFRWLRDHVDSGVCTSSPRTAVYDWGWSAHRGRHQNAAL